MDRCGTGPLSFGATFWIPGAKTERTAKKWRKDEQKWARNSHLKRVLVADLFLMDRYMEIKSVAKNKGTNRPANFMREVATAEATARL